MSEPRELVLLSQARRALSEARTLDELKTIRDKAEAVRAYMRERGESLHVVNAAAEIKLRAERRLGVMLKDARLRGGDRRSNGRDDRLKLSDEGITQTDSKRWQRIAAVPDGPFERFIRETGEADQKLTTAAALRLERSLREAGRDSSRPCGERKVEDLRALSAAGYRFGTIYADPPWAYGNQGTRAATDRHYQTMTVEEIAALPISDLAAEPSHLHLWTTNAFLFEAKRIIEAWGFTYKSCFVWVKPQIGIGNYWRVSHEFLLLGVRGACSFADKALRSWLQAERTLHSAKPPAVRALVERASPGPRLELFGRATHPGWTVWGNEVDGPLFQEPTRECV